MVDLADPYAKEPERHPAYKVRVGLPPGLRGEWGLLCLGGLAGGGRMAVPFVCWAMAAACHHPSIRHSINDRPHTTHTP